MKRLLLTLTMSLPLCLHAGTYTVPLAGDFQYNLLGSQFSATETVDTYGSFIPGGPSDGDTIAFWNVSLQDFSSVVPQYATFSHRWNPTATLPLGTAFFYVPTDGNKTITRTSGSLPTPTPVTLSPNLYYALSSQTPTVATYQNLVGDLSAIPNPQTFVFAWNVALEDFDPPFRYAHSLWQPSPPSIPVGLGAFVVYYAPDAGPSLSTVQVSGGTCPPLLTLTLTFSGSPVDQFSAADPANYTIYLAPGIVVGGSVISATPTLVSSGGTILKTVQDVVLQISLMTEPGDVFGNVYYIDTVGVTSVGGTPCSPSRMSFTPCSGSPPANDEPGGAIALTSGVTAYGSLKCATHSVLSVTGVPQYPIGTTDAKDVWYTFTPAASGSVTVDTCEALPSGCPQSRTVLAVYQGYPGAPLTKLTGTWFNTGGACSSGAQLTFTAQGCTTYYIRVSTTDTGDLPGDFALKAVLTPTPPANDACSGRQIVSANSSTSFDNLNATTDGPASEAVFNDIWFHFQAPPPGSDPSTTVETCSANFNTALAVYADNGNCPPLSGDLVAFNSGFCGMGSQVSFNATASQGYFVRVGGHTATDFGCGFLHVSSGIPAAGTPPSSSGTISKFYNISGLPNNVGWTWSLTAPPPCNVNVQDTVPGVASGLTAFDIAVAFANSINSHPPLVALPGFLVPYADDGASLEIRTPCNAGDLELKVGSSLPPTCWVDFALLTVSFPPCNFNPVIYEIGDPNGLNTDCNGNGRADYLDILLGASQDANGNGIPDECEACVPVVVASGPGSTRGYLGGPATFTVQTLGSGPFTYQWRKDGSPLAGQTGATLALTDLPLSAAGLYDVVVSNACGSTTSPHAALAVSAQPWLNVARADTNIVLSWSAPNYKLQSSSALDASANWTNIPGASPIMLPIDIQARYFRLQTGR